MREISIPDDIYLKAVHAAGLQQVSVEEFVTSAVQLKIEGTGAVRLSVEQLSIVQKSREEIREGNGVTIEEAERKLAEHLATRVRAKKAG
jgi:hypothetical protein